MYVDQWYLRACLHTAASQIFTHMFSDSDSAQGRQHVKSLLSSIETGTSRMSCAHDSEQCDILGFIIVFGTVYLWSGLARSSCVGGLTNMFACSGVSRVDQWVSYDSM